MADEVGGFRQRAAVEARELLGEATKTCWAVLKIIVPISIAVRFLEQWGVIDKLGEWLGPVMGLVGLPGEMGLVWATAMFMGIYAAMVVFVTLLPQLQPAMTVAQTTVLATMMLVAHGLPQELRICQKAGPRMRVVVLIRVAGALALGWILWQIYARGGWLAATNVPLWRPATPDPSWWGWAESQFWLMAKIFAIIVGLLLLMKLLEWTGVMRLLNRLLEPVLRALGMTPAAAPLAIIGMTLGLSYGGGLIIRQAQSGRLGKRDIFYSLMLMSLCHSVIEDTLLMAALGAHFSGVLIARLVFSLALTFVLVKLLGRVSERTFDKWLFRTSALKADGGGPVDRADAGGAERQR